jgi:hypothetical protein
MAQGQTSVGKIFVNQGLAAPTTGNFEVALKGGPFSFGKLVH